MMLIEGRSRSPPHRTRFAHGNHSAALVHDTLRHRLSSCGAMAGDASIAAEFAASYDEAATSSRWPRSAISSTPSRPAAGSPRPRWPTTAGPRTAGSISGRTVFTDTPCVAGYVAVLPCTLPSALGGDLSGSPGWASWILDQVEGFVWPDADVSRACAPRPPRGATASYQVDDLRGVLLDRDPVLRGPPLPRAGRSPARSPRRCRTAATPSRDQCVVLAQACEEVRRPRRRAARGRPQPGPRPTARRRDHRGHRDRARRLHRRRLSRRRHRPERRQDRRRRPRGCSAPSSRPSAPSPRPAPRRVRFAATALRDVRVELAVFKRGADHGRLCLRRRAGGARGAVEGGSSGNLKLFDPNELRGLSAKQVAEICRGWPIRRVADGRGLGL